MAEQRERERGGKTWLLVAIGAITYVAAWFLPTWSAATAIPEDGVRKWAPGWVAFCAAWEMTITSETTLSWPDRLVYATARPLFFVCPPRSRVLADVTGGGGAFSLI